MITADQFLTAARARGFDFYTGVPCSFLTPIINRVISDPTLDYVGAASEGEAAAIASGAWLAGRKTVVMCQNSGLGNLVNPLTSLNTPFEIPTLMIVTWRGQPGLKDEPQHALMGEITAALLETMRIEHAPFPQTEEAIEGALATAVNAMSTRRLPFAFIMEKGAVSNSGLDQPAPRAHQASRHADLTTSGPRPSRFDVLRRLQALVPKEAALVATTGKAGRELFTLDDRAQQLYQVGAMGCASGMALGVALNSSRPTIVIDGDGAALMKMGTLATIGAQAPTNFVHLLLDNGVHDSTGGQATVSDNVSFAGVAAACGYPATYTCDDLEGFEKACRAALESSGPTMIEMKIAPGSVKELGRPTVKPPEVARRFQAFLAGN